MQQLHARAVVQRAEVDDRQRSRRGRHRAARVRRLAHVEEGLRQLFEVEPPEAVHVPLVKPPVERRIIEPWQPHQQHAARPARVVLCRARAGVARLPRRLFTPVRHARHERAHLTVHRAELALPNPAAHAVTRAYADTVAAACGG
eukprot:5465556-Prymnesium_polylepis.2